MANPERPSVWSHLLDVLLRYGAWLLFSASGLWIVLQLRINLLDLLIVLRVSHWSIPAIDKTATILFILAWLAGVMGLEYYLASIETRREFWQRTRRVAFIEVGVLLFSYGLQALI